MALLFLSALAAHAQEPVSAEGTTRTVAGRVVADETGEPLENVLVELVVQGLHALTDSRGRFRIDGAAPVLDTLVASYFALSEMRRALDLSHPGDQRVELRLAGAPASPEAPELTEVPAEAASIDCSTWLVDVHNRADRPAEVYPWLGDPDADLSSLSETERARGTGELITVLAIGDRRVIRLRASRPVLMLYGSRVSEAASGTQRRIFAGWVTPEERRLRRMQGLRLQFSCEEPQK